MKNILFLVLLAISFCSCSKSSTAPTYTLIGTWQMTSQTTVTTYKDGTPTTTRTITFLPNDETLVFGSDEAKYDERGFMLYMGPYSYSGNTITYANNSFLTTQTVLTLTDKTLVVVSTKRILGDVKESTDTFNRL
ncbi:hypothetical protein [Hymenobacter negativus]|uniref:Lipocalin-like domain-containing protein n=1 Tax=Hymenobacter negativus TaxID=2795026 RepID=A0ABS0QD57_9BACT|nr:hypothetical protein [Hymenobacter negativus]MBH8560552.1 hypothetical protein [Hymenobacter negativus]